MSILQPTDNTQIIIDDFIQYATTHLTSVSGIINTISLYPPVGTPAPGIVVWSGYTIPPASKSTQPVLSVYDTLDWSKIPLDKNDPEVQEIINPNINKINQKIVQSGATDDLGKTGATQMNNVKAEIIDKALYEQGIIKIPDTDDGLKSGYKTLDELLRIAGNLAPKLGKNARVSYSNLKSGYIKGVHGLCPQGTQAVVAALTGINGLGRISGNADWFSFKNPSTGGGRSSFSIPVAGQVYYNDKIKVGNEYLNSPTQWQVGDIIVMGYTGGKPYGHIQVWTGFKWVSDFTQNKIQTNNVDFTTIALWRLNEAGKRAVQSQNV